MVSKNTERGRGLEEAWRYKTDVLSEEDLERGECPSRGQGKLEGEQKQIKGDKMPPNSAAQMLFWNSKVTRAGVSIS